ncbi:putative ribonuclease H-like domain-containing protein [Tanacetum coccineum]
MGKPSYSRFTKTNDFKGVPHPLSGDYTPKPQEEIDDSLYVYGKKGPQKPEISVSDDNSSEHSTCQSNDSDDYYGKYLSTLLRLKSKSSHLIKDCDYYEKKMAREAEVKRVVNTGNGVAKPVWTNANRINHYNKFVPRSVQLNAGRPKFKSVRPNINTGRTNINSGRSKVNAVSSNFNTVRSRQTVLNKTSNSSSPKRPQMNQMNQRREFSKSYSSVRRPFAKSTAQMANSNAVMGSWGSAVKTSASYTWRNSRPNFNYNKLGHFNLSLNPQICDKQHKVLFTETECLVVSSDFKMPDENQILLKVPRHHNMYSFDMKTPSPAKGFACLIAPATFDESKLWHRRLGHINFKNLNKLVKGNLVRGLPSKVFKNDHTCVACHKGKQHRASCKAKLERLITEPLHTLHMDLFGPTSVKKINHAKDTLSVLGKFDGKSDEGFLVGVGYSLDVLTIDYLTDSMNYIPVSLENQANPHAGASEVTNSAGTPTSIASEEKDEEVELIVVPSAVKIPEEKDESRTSSTNSKERET